MKIDIITVFPAIVTAPLNQSIIKRAKRKKAVQININDLRGWTIDKHKTVDDAPYGGGSGMIFKVEPLFRCLQDLTRNSQAKKSKIILTSPRGGLFDYKTAVRLSLLDHLIIICGHYKGVDERIKSLYPIQEISIGDYVLSGGELAALVMIDALVRLLPGVLNDIDSALTDSFNDLLLDCDYYTRPAVFQSKSVPKILLSGDHKKIESWRQRCKEKITRKNRPDLYQKYRKEIKKRK
jgi:tRNA (guanine37-N1)-methyltransferase